jgi:REP element-mobilizing transposase RayT
MANTYTQIYTHIVFSVKNRQNLINENFRDELYKYIVGIVKNNQHKPLAINGMPDHVHIFIGLNPKISVSDVVRDIKANSSKFINDRSFTKGRFEWQEGFGAFSYSHSQIDSVVKYIRNQESHHKKRTFKEEYLELLKKFDIEYDNRYVF